MKGRWIGEGNTAEIYLWGSKEILKLFRQMLPPEQAEREYRTGKVVEELGLPVPKVGDLLELEGRKGIIYERIEGISLMELLTKHPMKMNQYSRQLAELHYQIHLCKLDKEKLEMLPKYKESLEWNIRHTPVLTEEQRLLSLSKLEQLPEGEYLCHGDFYPGNVIVTKDRCVILDWMTAASGSQAADVARALYLLKDAIIPGRIPMIARFFINLGRKQMANVYLKEYLKLSSLTKENITDWRLPILSARLTEWVPKQEMSFILKEIESLTAINHR
jgi:uncharacterized protein (TIGR02172 family)